ncbi:MAG: hypothetical protein LBP54_07540 [Campylobacteraceae bacterium]|jgi:hypothetical protein|nr:hypothetical protein [Campylobacteraceae bacterium]
MDRKFLVSATLLLVVVFGFSGCPSTQQITLVPSDGKSANVEVESEGQIKQQMTIPGNITVFKSSKPVIINVKEDEQTKTGSYSVESEPTALLFIALVLTSPLTTTIGAATGEFWEYDNQTLVPVTRK